MSLNGPCYPVNITRTWLILHDMTQHCERKMKNVSFSLFPARTVSVVSGLMILFLVFSELTAFLTVET